MKKIFNWMHEAFRASKIAFDPYICMCMHILNGIFYTDTARARPIHNNVNIKNGRVLKVGLKGR